VIVDVAVASSFTIGVAMLCTVFGHRSLFELDIVAMVVLGFLGLRRAAAPRDGESGSLILLISLPAALIGTLVALVLVASRAVPLLR
jgi:hypothetical protein